LCWPLPERPVPCEGVDDDGEGSRLGQFVGYRGADIQVKATGLCPENFGDDPGRVAGGQTELVVSIVPTLRIGQLGERAAAIEHGAILLRAGFPEGSWLLP
jgi:hypothetical protein